MAKLTLQIDIETKQIVWELYTSGMQWRPINRMFGLSQRQISYIGCGPEPIPGGLQECQ